MRARLRKQLEQRTQLLAGVSHDLRTPLTRLRLQLALMPDSEERQAAQRDLAEMENALEEYLAFARGQAGEEQGPVDLTLLCETLGDDAARQGVDLQLDLGRRRGDPGPRGRAQARLLQPGLQRRRPC
jgi:two-component system osmolarity sensor histidine kinase EnvZ